MPADQPLSFLKLPRRTRDALDGARAVIVGASHGSPYKPGEVSHAAHGPEALRKASDGFARQLQQYDFDLGATLFAGGDTRGAVDAGDIETSPGDPDGNRARIEAAIRAILDAGAVPILLGGDDSVPVPAFRAFEGHGPLTVVQLDAHVDWGDVIQGNPFGYGSTMRRAAEHPWITGMVQVGMRGLGSGEASQHDDARAFGAHIIEARTLHREGVEHVLRHIPEGGRCVITIDCDALDPSILPAVNMPTPGGLTYQDVIDLLHGVAGRARIAGLNLVELVPERDDPHGLSAMTAARIVTTGLGLILRQAEEGRG